MTLPDRRRQHLVDAAADTLARVAVHLARVDGGTTVMDRIRQAQGGVGAQRFDGSPPGPNSDPTGNQAAAAADGETWATDRATALIREFDRLVIHIHNGAAALLRIVAEFPAPSVGANDELVRDATAPQGCELCAGTRDSRGRPRWSPLDVRRRSATTVGGRLEVPRWLCSWCADWIETTGREPSPAEIARHHEIGRVPWPKDVRHPA